MNALGRLVLIGLVLAIGLVVFWMIPLKLIVRLAGRLGHSAPCPAAVGWLVNNPIRRRYMGRAMERFGIRRGETVLELGPGPGALTVDAARKAGPEGRLVAVDIQAQMIAAVEKRVAEAGLGNVETHVTDAYDLPLEDESADRAFLVTVLPEIPDQARALAELRRVLKPGGVLSITEEFSDPDYQFASETIRRVEAAGFEARERFGGLWLYTVNFVKPAGSAGQGRAG
jgi:SAM-dependent methyltransferase